MHECATSEQIEVLIIATELDITGTVFASDRNTVISLHDRIEELLERYTDSRLVPLREVVTIEHLRDGEVLREFTDSREVHSIESLTIVVDLQFRDIDNTRELLEKSTSMFLCLSTRQHRTLGILVTRITYLSRRITKKKDSSMSHLLELAKLHKRYHMPDMDTRSHRIDTELHDKPLS
jgi:hypothetical protein